VLKAFFFLEILAHIDWIASYIWWRFVGCTSRARSSHCTTSQKSL